MITKNTSILLFAIIGICCFFHGQSINLVWEKSPNSEYNITESIQNAKFAALAFCNKSCIDSWSCRASRQLPFQDQIYIEDKLSLTAGFIGYRPDTQAIVASWRGSDNKRNWYEDFNFQMVPYNRCKNCFIHAGFFADFLILETRIFQKIDSLIKKYDVRRIVNTGHSLGAAITLIAGLQLKLRYGNKLDVEIHNFGQPRVGNTHLAQFMNSKLDGIYRVVHNKDLVPHVPPTFFKYVHTANQIFFDAQMKNYTVCNSSGEDPKCSNQFFPNYESNDHDFYFFNMPGQNKNC